MPAIILTDLDKRNEHKKCHARKIIPTADKTISINRFCTKQMKENRKQQTYKNHVHYVPLYHFLTFLAMVILIAGAIYSLINSKNEQILQSLLFLLIVFTLISVSFHSRSFSRHKTGLSGQKRISDISF